MICVQTRRAALDSVKDEILGAVHPIRSLLGAPAYSAHSGRSLHTSAEKHPARGSKEERRARLCGCSQDGAAEVRLPRRGRGGCVSTRNRYACKIQHRGKACTGRSRRRAGRRGGSDVRRASPGRGCIASTCRVVCARLDAASAHDAHTLFARGAIESCFSVRLRRPWRGRFVSVIPPSLHTSFPPSPFYPSLCFLSTRVLTSFSPPLSNSAPRTARPACGPAVRSTPSSPPRSTSGPAGSSPATTPRRSVRRGHPLKDTSVTTNADFDNLVAECGKTRSAL
ncbi:hypothetical protein B0H19DRAFT_1228091, partial [Mycena capillaripes]